MVRLQHIQGNYFHFVHCHKFFWYCIGSFSCYLRRSPCLQNIDRRARFCHLKLYLPSLELVDFSSPSSVFAFNNSNITSQGKRSSKISQQNHDWFKPVPWTSEIGWIQSCVLQNMPPKESWICCICISRLILPLCVDF